MEFAPHQRARLLELILDDVQPHFPDEVLELRATLVGAITSPVATVGSDSWNADRLNKLIGDIDASLASGEYGRAITLSYTCMEGFYKAFVRHRVPDAAHTVELIALPREIRKFIGTTHSGFPNEVLNMITYTTHAVDRARNHFSESHFERNSTGWLATYVRDLVSTQVRPLSHFLGDLR